MFGKKRKLVSDIDTLIGSMTKITGDVQFSSGLRVDGYVKGSISASTKNDKQHALLVLSEQGMVEGKIEVPYLVINGTVKGPIYSSENIELQPNAKITGDIYYKTIKIHQGAVVDGKMVCNENSQPEKLITYVASGNGQTEEEE